MHPASSPTSAWKPALACSPVLPSSSRRVAVGFFGLSRNLRSTLPTIERNVIAPLREASGGLLDTFVHAMLLTSITNARSSEFAEPIDPLSFLAVQPCRLAAEDQHAADAAMHLEELTARWNTTKQPLSTKYNALRARYSLWRLSKLIVAYEEAAGIRYAHIAAVRPDTSFLSLLPRADALLQRAEPGIWLPNAHHWNGTNDRFAHGDATSMLTCYMTQYEAILERGRGRLVRGGE